jgi:geranylgeranyl reductase family protein
VKVENANVILVNSDTVVVGAGPTGSFSASYAAKLGAQVSIYEEHTESGTPPHCTGHISLAGLKQLDLRLPKKVFENEIKSAIFYSPSNCKFPVRFSIPVTCVINRTQFDQYLRDKAVEAGVQILYNRRVTSLLIKRNRVLGIEVKTPKKTEKIRSQVVINAEGVSSTLLKHANLPSLNSQRTVNGIEAEVDRINDSEIDSVEVFLTRVFAPGLYAWIVPRKDGTAKIGLGTERGHPLECLQKFISHNPIARHRLKGSHITQLVYHPIPLGGPISQTVHKGLLIVGDAASHVKPTTGGGIIMGLMAAKIAGKVAASAIQEKSPDTQHLLSYERLWKKKIGFDMTIMKHLRRLLNSLSDRKLDQLITISRQLKLDESLKEAKNIDFQGSSLIRLIRHPRFLAMGFYMALAHVF